MAFTIALLALASVIALGAFGYAASQDVTPPSARVGGTWRVHIRWSGYGIASESRRDGGSYDIRVTKINGDMVKVEGLGDRDKWRPWREVIDQHLLARAEKCACNMPQYRHYRSEYLGVTSAAKSRRSEFDSGVSEAIRRGGVSGASAYYRSTCDEA